MPRLATGRGIRARWAYDVAEVAVACGVHRNTVRQWIKDGLPVVSTGKPYLVRGSDLKEFLRDRNARRKQPCANGFIYCLPCHAPKRPAGGMVDFEQTSETSGTLIGICPDCERVIRRHESLAKLDEVAAGLEVNVLKAGAEETLSNATTSPVNCDFR